MKTIQKKFLITKDHYEDKGSASGKMQAPAYTEEEYWQKKEKVKHQPQKIKRTDLRKILPDLKDKK